MVSWARSESMRFWYGETWWHEDQFRGELSGNPSIAEVDRAVERVADLFDETWFVSCHGHPAVQWLLFRGIIPLQFLYGLGVDLLEVEGINRSQSLFNDLKVASQFRSAHFELGIASLFRRNGFTIQFRPDSAAGKHADLVVRIGDEEAFYELKRMEEAKSQDAVHQLATYLMMAASEIIDRRFPSTDTPKCAIELAPNIADMFCDKPELDTAVFSTYASMIQEELEQRCGDPLPIEFVIPSVASVRVGREGDLYSGISHPLLSAELELKRILRGPLLEAVKQLASLSPSIVLIESGGLLDPLSASAVVSRWLGQSAERANISGVIFVPAIPVTNGRVWLFPAFAVQNPRARAAARGLASYRCLCEAFGVHE
jgi:hypothetical protein